MRWVADRLTLLSLCAGVLADHWTIGVATSGIAPARPLARHLAYLFGRASGAVSARTASLKEQRAIRETGFPSVRRRATLAGQRLIRDIDRGRAIPPLKSAWIGFLRRTLLPRLVTRHPEEFAAILQIWREKGWLERRPQARLHDRPEQDENRRAGEDSRTQPIRKEANAKPGEQGDRRESIQHQDDCNVDDP